MRFKRIRHSLKSKRNQDAFDQAKEELENMKTRCSEKNIDLYYFDESGVSSNSSIPYGWQPIGCNHEQPKNVFSQRVNILGFMNLTGNGYFYYEKGRVTSSRVIEAFENFIKEKDSKKPCYIVLDNAKIHKSKEFKKEAKKWEEKNVFLFFIPPYSPELNLIEILWKNLKEGVTNSV